MTTTETHPGRIDERPAADEPGARAGGSPQPAPQPDVTARPRRFGLWLAVVTLAGLAVRLVYLFGWRNPWPVLGDPYYYHHGANLLADGEGYVHPYQFLLFGVRMPGADHPPGYLTVLAAFSWFGLRSFVQHQVVSCLLGAGGIVAMGLAGRRIGGERVGLIVAAFTAFSANVFPFDAMVVSETLVVSTTAIVLIAAYRWWDKPTTGAAVAFGLAIGVAALVRSEAILLGPLIGLPLVWGRRRALGAAAADGDRGAPNGRSWRPWLTQVVAAGAVAAIVIGPWVGYNMARFERPTTLSAQFDQTLGTANCDDVYYGERTGYWSLACIQRTEHLVGEGDASAQGRGFARIARQYMRDHAERVPLVVGARVGRTFGLYQPHNQIQLDHDVEAKEHALGELGLVTWYAIAVAGGVGLLGLRRAGRPIFPLVLIVGSVVVTVALIYGNTRFRLPAELALMIPAAVSLDAAVSALRSARAARGAGLTAPAIGIAEPAPTPDDIHAHGDRHPEGLVTDPAAGGSGAIGTAPTGAEPARIDPTGTDPAADDTVPGDTAADPPGGLGSASGSRFAGLDGMRALAALGVLVCHVALHVGFSPHNRFGHYFARLDVGVAVFFVLSGFLLYRPFVARRMDGRPRPATRDYLRNRFLRIFPAYWLALTILGVVLDVRHRNDIQSFWDFIRYYGLLQSYSNSSTLGGLQQAWTLTNEIAFYLVLPLWALAAAAVARRLRRGWAVAVELAALAAAGAGALLFNYLIHTFGNDDVTTGTFDARLHWLPANFHLFVPGMALAVALEWSRRRDRPLAVLELPRRHPVVCWAAAGACFWVVATQIGLRGVDVGPTAPGQAVEKELLYASVGFLLVLPVALAGATLPRVLSWLGSRPVVVLGILSYGIYLWHEGVTDIYREIFDVPIFTGSFPKALAFTLAGSVAIAALSYVVIERPALALKDRHRRLFTGWRPVGLPAETVPA
jgi:peptidoglycan/LPS O-acetylase OafA/YrhL